MVKVPVSSAAKPKLMRTALALLSLKAVDVGKNLFCQCGVGAHIAVAGSFHRRLQLAFVRLLKLLFWVALK